MRTVCCRLDLGVTRIAGYTLYNENNHDFEETTPKAVKNLIIQGEVKGLKLKNGEIEIDEEGFYISNLIIKSSVGRYRPLYPTASIVSCMYALVRVIIKTDNETIYEIISNKCARLKFSTEQLKGLIEIGGYVAGVRMINNEIEVCKGVRIDDRRSKSEQIDNSSNTEVEEVKSSLNGSVQEQQNLTVLKTEIKPDEAGGVNKTASTEKVDSLEVVDTIEDNKLTSESDIKADDESLNTSNIKEAEGAKPLEEHIDKKDMSSPRKNKRK